MMDSQTGLMVPLNIEGADIEKLRGTLDEKMAELQRLKDEAIPDRSRQGAVLEINEVLLIRGSRFRVDRISGNRVYLEGLPSLPTKPATETIRPPDNGHVSAPTT